MEPTTVTPKRRWYLDRRLLLLVGGLLLGIILTLVVSALIANRGTQARISCHKPTTQNTQTEYCVYFKRGEVVIGTDGSRGLTYQTPYKQDQLSTNWDTDTDALTVTMPSTKLIIQASEYTTNR